MEQTDSHFGWSREISKLLLYRIYRIKYLETLIIFIKYNIYSDDIDPTRNNSRRLNSLSFDLLTIFDISKMFSFFDDRVLIFAIKLPLNSYQKNGNKWKI